MSAVRLLAGTWLMAFYVVDAAAGAFSINPVTVSLSAARKVEAVTVVNDGAAPTNIQLELVAWQQSHDGDLYTPTRDLIATPPIFSIPPGGKQVVRIGLRNLPTGSDELAYRLYLREIPAITGAGGGVQVALRIGVPVFVEPSIVTPAGLTWKVKRTTDGELQLFATNSGKSHIQITHLLLQLPRRDSGATTIEQRGAYLLAGSTHSWTLAVREAEQVGVPLHLTAYTEHEKLEVPLVLE